jgi:hypothetical protein
VEGEALAGEEEGAALFLLCVCSIKHWLEYIKTVLLFKKVYLLNTVVTLRKTVVETRQHLLKNK